MKFANVVFPALLCVALLPSVHAQMGPLKPAPELKKLDYFVGTWKMDGEMKPGPMGPGGKMMETEKVQWMDGNFFLVMNDDFKGDMGSGTGVAYLGYDSNDKMYTYDAFNSTGEAEHSKGNVDGDTWTWTSDEKMGGMTVKGRFIVKTLTPTSYNFKFDMSQDGTNWSTVMEGKATKQ